MKRNYLLLLMLAMLSPWLSRSQAYIGDYVFSSFAGTFSSISTTGTQLSALEGTDASTTVTLPFAFPFGRDTVSQIWVTPYGQIGMGLDDPADYGYETHTNDMDIIVPLGQYYYLSSETGGGHVYYEVQGASPYRSMVIEYNHVRLNSSSASSNYYTFQVVLYENGDVDFIYDTCVATQSSTAYVFMREHDVNSALAVTGNWSALSAGHNVNSISLSGTNVPTPGLTINFTRPINNCPRPRNFICRSFTRPDSVVMAWNSSDIASVWELRYDTVGTPVDSMTNVISTITDTFYICNNLYAGGSYQAYLRTDCGSEQSFWEGPIDITPGSYNMKATGTDTIYACGGIIYDNGGAMANYTNSCNSELIVRPSHPDSVVRISGTLSTESCCDHLYIYDGVGISGTLLYQGQGVSQTIPPVRSSYGPLTIRFVSDGSVVNSGFSLNVSCERAPLCRYIMGVDVDNVVGASALLSWTLSGGLTNPAYFQVTVINMDDSTQTPFIDTTSNLYYLISGLQPGTHYKAIANSYCDNAIVLGDSIEFTTHCLVGGTTNPSGTSLTSVTGVPVCSGWGNTFCQSIFTVSDLLAMGLTPGPINGITYTWSSAGSYNKDLVIFLGTTANSTFSSFSPLTGSMTQVYSGQRTTSDVGTIEYYFDTPFVWDGTSNIVLSSFVNQPAGVTHSSSGFYGYSSNCGVTRSIYGYKDNVAYTISNLTTNSSSSTSSYRPNVSFIKPCDTNATCAVPNLIVTDLNSDSVSVIWAPGYTETSWSLSYKAQTATSWTTVETAFTDRAYTFTGLLPMTTYLLRVAPDCGGDSIFAQVEVTTPCVPLTELPFTENFENFVASSTTGSPITNCWARGTSYSYNSYPYLSTSYAYSGTHSIYFYGTTTYYSYLCLPAMAASIDSLQVSFALRKTSANYSVQVGVMTDPNDFSTFSTVANVSPTNINEWQLFEIPLSNYVGNGHFIAFATSGATSYVYLDDVEVDYIPSCPRPNNITVTGVTTSNASIHWNASGSNYFIIEYGPAGFEHGDGITVTSSADSVTLYGLDHSTRYEFYVRGICGGSDTSNWSFVNAFTTACGIIDQLPYSQNFSGWGVGTSARPACWACGGYSSYPYILAVNDNNGVTIGHTLYMYSYSANQVYASLPELDSVSYPVHMVQTIFQAWANNTTSNLYSHDLVVGVCSNQGDLSSFTPVDTVFVTGTPAIYEVAFDPAIGAGKYITFVSYPTAGTTSYNTVYLDSVAVELIPDCQTPNQLTSDNVSFNSVDLSWNERNVANLWQVEYGPHGFTLGSGTRINATTYPITLNGLTPSTCYDFYVRSICSATDTSNWSREVGYFCTMQNPATIPYFYDFETPAEWDNWQTSTNYSSVNWYRDTAGGNGTPGFYSPGRYSMFISADTGRTCSTDMSAVVNVSAYRDIDFGPIDSSFNLTFRARSGGTSGNAYDALMVFLVDPTIPVVSSNANLTSPWGMVNDMRPLSMIRLTNWTTVSVNLDSVEGVQRLAFFWFNQATGTESFISTPASVDDISIDYIGCPTPANLRASNVTMASAQLGWYGPADGDYRVTVRNNHGLVVVSELVHSNTLSLTGLNPASNYTVYVRRICSSTDSSALSPAFTFTTAICNNSFGDTVATTPSSVTSYYIPVNNYYGYSYSQQIVLASELHGSGEISAIDFKYAYTSANTAKSNCTIYVGHTTKSQFSSNTDFVDPADMQMVYAGTLSSTNGWNHFVFNNPFPYDGVRNLVIAVDDNNGNYNGTSYTYYVDQTSAPMSLSIYSDSQNPNPRSLDDLLNFSGTPSTFAYRNQVVLEFCPNNPCSTPILRNPIVRSTNATLRWRNTSSHYQVSYRRASTTSWLADMVDVEDTFFVIPSLYPMTDYVYRVRQFCDSVSVSNWVEGTFNSADVPCLSPMGLHVTSVTNNKVSLAWQPEENNLTYTLHVFNSYFDNYANTIIARGSVSGLDAAMTYYATVQAHCQGFEEPSEWSDTIMFTTDICPDATNLTASNIQGNSVVLDWTDGGRAEKWEIQYGPMGFIQGSGLSVIAESHPYTLTDLVGETEYDIYVRGICGTNFYSEHWSNCVTITTPYSGISMSNDDTRVRLHPNPTSSDVELILPANVGAFKVEVIDVAGRVQLSGSYPSGSENIILPTSGLEQGAYFVRVVGDRINTVKKLIIK